MSATMIRANGELLSNDQRRATNLAGPYRRIFHYHVMKCGGTTLNRWLDTLTSDERAFREEAWQRFAVVEKPPDGTGKPSSTVVPSLAKTLFHWSDVVHHHGPLRMYAPENTFCVTVGSGTRFSVSFRKYRTGAG